MIWLCVNDNAHTIKTESHLMLLNFIFIFALLFAIHINDEKQSNWRKINKFIIWKLIESKFFWLFTNVTLAGICLVDSLKWAQSIYKILNITINHDKIVWRAFYYFFFFFSLELKMAFNSMHLRFVYCRCQCKISISSFCAPSFHSFVSNEK